MPRELGESLFEFVQSKVPDHVELPELPDLPNQAAGGPTSPPDNFPQQAIDALADLPEQSQAHLPDWLLSL